MFTGRLPLRADPRDPVAWAHAVAEEEPEPDARCTDDDRESADGERRGQRNPARRNGPRAGGDLEAIVAKALAKDPAQRYVSMEALSADWALSRRRPVQARRAGTFYRLRRFATAIGGVVIAVVAVVAIAIETWLAGITCASNAIAQPPLHDSARHDASSSDCSPSPSGENRGERLTANQILERGAAAVGPSGPRLAVDAAVAVEIGRAQRSAKVLRPRC
jgi:serine/threonine-protein kinase